MVQILQHRRNTTAALTSERGSDGEIIIDTTKKTVVVMDGVTNGGTPLAKESDIPVNVSELVNDAGYITSAAVFSGDYNDLSNKPTLFSGAYADLTGKPTTLSGYGITDAATSAQGIKADTAVQPADLSVYQLANNDFTGNVIGSVYGANNTLLVDATNKKVVAAIEAPSIVSASYVDAATGVNASSFGSVTPGQFINLGSNASIINVVTGIDMLGHNIVNVDGFYSNTAQIDTLTLGLNSNIFGNGSNLVNFNDVEANTFKATRYGGESDVIYSPDDVVSGLGHLTYVRGGLSGDDAGGAIYIDGGAGTSSGDVNIGTINTGLITIGRPGSTAEVYGTLDLSSTTVTGLSYTPTLISSGETSPGSAVVTSGSEINFNFSEAGTMASIGRTAITLGNTTLGTGDTEHVVLNALTRIQLNSARISFINVTVPASSVGAVGDSEGMIALDSNYFYYCTDLYDGVTNIWKRIAWLSDTW